MFQWSWAERDKIPRGPNPGNALGASAQPFTLLPFASLSLLVVLLLVYSECSHNLKLLSTKTQVLWRTFTPSQGTLIPQKPHQFFSQCLGINGSSLRQRWRSSAWGDESSSNWPFAFLSSPEDLVQAEMEFLRGFPCLTSTLTFVWPIGKTMPGVLLELHPSKCCQRHCQALAALTRMCLNTAVMWVNLGYVLRLKLSYAGQKKDNNGSFGVKSCLKGIWTLLILFSLKNFKFLQPSLVSILDEED